MTTNYFLLSPYFLTLLISCGITLYMYKHRSAKGAFPYLIFSICETAYVGGFLLETFNTSLSGKIFWDNFQFLPTLILPAAYLIFSYEFVGYKQQDIKKMWIKLLAVPVLFILLIVFDPWLKLIRPTSTLLNENGVVSLYYPFTLTVYLLTAYAYALVFYGMVVLFREIWRSPINSFRVQIIILLAAGMAPMLVMLLTIFEVVPDYIRDISPLGFGLGNIIFAIGVSRISIFDVVPVAKELIIETMETAIIVLDARNCIVDMNASALRILNMVSKDVIGFAVKDVLVDYPLLLEKYVNQESVEDTLNVDYNGRRSYFDFSIVPIKDKSGEVVGRLISLNNITSRINLENQLQETNVKLQKEKELIEKASNEVASLHRLSEYLQASVTIDEACNIIANHMSSLFTGTHGGLYLMNDGFSDFALMTTWGEFAMESTIQPDDCWGMRRGRVFVRNQFEISPACKHFGEKLPRESICLPLLAQGETIGVICLYTEQEDVDGYFTYEIQNLAVASADSIALALANLRLRERLHNQSVRDPLTGLFNRRYLEETLTRETHRASRSQHPLCIIMFEIDDFKRYNNTFGHEAGDYVLRKVADTMRANLRRSDFPCRYGGDEFTLLLPETTLEDGAQRAEGLRKAVDALTLSYNNQALGQVTVRMGVAVYPKHGETGEAVLKVADDASYQARAIGKNCVVVAE